MSLTILNAYGEPITTAQGLNVRVEDKGGYSRARFEAPGYRPRTVMLGQAGSTQRIFLGFDLDTARVPDIEFLEGACATNLHAAMRFAPIYHTTLKCLVSAPVEWHQDRIYYAVKAAVDRETIAAFDRTEAWTRANSSLHRGPAVNASESEGTFGNIPWENRGSWKQAQVEPGLQVVVWWRDPEGYVFEVDIDERKGIFGHAYEALRNRITGRLTHPHVINQALAKKRGIISYRLEPGPE
jgi:hypothetical protein